MASLSKSASSTAFQIRPHCAAVSAASGSPRSASARARAAPIDLWRNSDVPPSSAAPSRTKLRMNRAERAAITISPARAIPTPAPAAAPFMATTTGIGKLRNSSITGLIEPRILSAIPSPAPNVSPPNCAPEQKPLPAPVSTTARARGSQRTSSSAAFRSLSRLPPSALYRSGLLSVRIAIDPRRSERTIDMTCPLPICGRRLCPAALIIPTLLHKDRAISSFMTSLVPP